MHRQRLLKYFAAQGFTQVVNLIIQIISVPLFLHYWGKGRYGEWLILSTIPTYLALSDLGFASAAGNDMTMKVAGGDKTGALRVYQSMWLLVSLVSLVALCIVTIFVSTFPVQVWLKLAHLTHRQVTEIMLAQVFQVYFGIQRGVLAQVYRCEGNYAVGNVLGSLLRLSELIIGAVVLSAGGQMWTYALVGMTVRMVENGLMRLDLYKRTPWLASGWRHASLLTVKELVGPAFATLGFVVSSAMSLQGMVLVVGIVLGPGPVVLFSSCRTLTRCISQVLNLVTWSIWLELSRAFGAGDIPLARSLHRRACQVTVWFALTACAILVVLGKGIFNLWTKGKVVFDPTLFSILLLVVVCNSFWTASYAVPISINRHQRLAIVYVFATSMSLGIAALMTRLYGLHGTAVSLLIIDMFMTYYVVRLSLSLVHDNLRAYLRVMAVPPFGWLMGQLRIVLSANSKVRARSAF